MEFTPFQMLEPVAFHVFDKKLRKQAEKLSTDGCEFVAGPELTIPHPVDPPEPVKPKPKKRPGR